MGLTPEDREYLDAIIPSRDYLESKFNEMHKRMSDHEKDDEGRFGRVAVAMQTAFTEHKAEDHSVGKLAATLGAIGALAAAFIAAILWLIQHAGKTPTP